MAVTFIQRFLNALFNRKKEGDAISKTKDRPTTREKTKVRNKAAKKAYVKSKANLKEKHKKESQAGDAADEKLKEGIQVRIAADEKLKLEIAARAATRVKNVVSEAEADEEERIRSCATEIKNCIDLINSSNKDTSGKPNKGRKRAKTGSRKADKNAGNHKASGNKNSDKGTKISKQDVSPAEMVKLLAKAGEKVSEAVVKAKEQDHKKRKEKREKENLI